MKKVLVIGIIVIGVLIAMAVLGIKLFGLKDIDDEKKYSFKGVSDINVTMQTESVHVIRANAGKDFRFHLYGKSMTEIKLASEESQGTLSVREDRANNRPVPEELYLDIYIPEDYGKSLSVEIASGDFRTEHLDLEDFMLKDLSGKMEMTEINAKNIIIDASSGKLEIGKAKADELGIRNKSGDIKIGDCIVEKGKIENKSGKMILESSSGNFDLKGSSGKIIISSKELNNQNINIENSAGSIALELPNTAEFLLEAETRTGKIKSDFTVNPSEITDNNRLSGQVGTKKNQITLKTKSGNINIVKQ